MHTQITDIDPNEPEEGKNLPDDNDDFNEPLGERQGSTCNEEVCESCQ